jgi:hypothetical protein
MAWAAALLMPACVALVLVWRAAPATLDRLWAAPTAIGIALGVASVFWSALFFSGIQSRGVLVALDLLAWSVVLAAIVALTRVGPTPSRRRLRAGQAGWRRPPPSRC